MYDAERLDEHRRVVERRYGYGHEESVLEPVLGQQDGKDERDPERVEHEEGEHALVAHLVQARLQLVAFGRAQLLLHAHVLGDQLAPEERLRLVYVADLGELDKSIFKEKSIKLP